MRNERRHTVRQLPDLRSLSRHTTTIPAGLAYRNYSARTGSVGQYWLCPGGCPPCNICRSCTSFVFWLGAGGVCSKHYTGGDRPRFHSAVERPVSTGRSPIEKRGPDPYAGLLRDYVTAIPPGAAETASLRVLRRYS